MDQEVDKRYPLCWPDGWPRKSQSERSWARFRVSDSVARSHMIAEVGRLGGESLIISTNIKLRNDGLPYANQPRLYDPGVAIYFKLDGKSMALACDMFLDVFNNVRALGKTIESMRGIERYGASDLMKRAFRGFEELPAPDVIVPVRSWWDVLGLTSEATAEEIRSRKLKILRECHPDCGSETRSGHRAGEVNQAAVDGFAARGVRK